MKFKAFFICTLAIMIMPLFAYSADSIGVSAVTEQRVGSDDESGKVGIVLDDDLTVALPIEGGPAYKAGIKSGEAIIKVNDVPLKGMTPDDAAKLLRGEPGSKVRLFIHRTNELMPVEVTLVRALDIGLTFNEELVTAAETRNLDEVRRLLADGVNANARNKVGITALHAVASYDPARGNLAHVPDAQKGAISIANLLISKGANVNAPRFDLHRVGYTPLHTAAGFGFKEMVSLLIADGADINAATNAGVTPLFIAANLHSTDIAELLVAKGANVNAMNRWRATPLHWAAAFGNESMVAFLLSKGANVNVKDEEGSTPLHLAAKKEHEETSVLLISHGADVNAKDEKGYTPFSVASKSANKNFADLFVTVPEGVSPSFGCRNRSTLNYIESRICAFPPLGNLDQKLSKAYYSAIKAARNIQNVREEQREWLKKRNNQCNGSSAECPMSMLMGMYSLQIARLNEIEHDPSSDDDQKIETYIRVGDTGTLTIRKPDSKTKIFSIESIGGNCHTCSVAGSIKDNVGKTEDQSDATEESSCLISFSKSGESFSVNPTASEACRGYCGMRASFDGVYIKPSKRCAAEARTMRYETATKQYKSKEFFKSEGTLKALINECGDFMSHIETDRIRNDLALSQFHQGNAKECLATLKGTIAASYRNEGHLKGAMPPCDFDNYVDVAQSTWLNQAICGKHLVK